MQIKCKAVVTISINEEGTITEVTIEPIHNQEALTATLAEAFGLAARAFTCQHGRS